MRQRHEYFTSAESDETAAAESLANVVFRQTCRFDLEAAGFSLIDLGPEFGSTRLRRLMVDLKRALARRYEAETGKTLHYLSMGRCDQQVTTRPHRDGAPDESILILGYEPTRVPSRLSLADYSRCAHDLGISPEQFLADLNPMFARGAELLGPYTTVLDAADQRHFQILTINNSCAALVPGCCALQGVLHQAEILEPMPAEQRIVNSTMLTVAERPAEDLVGTEQQDAFLHSQDVSGRS